MRASRLDVMSEKPERTVKTREHTPFLAPSREFHIQHEGEPDEIQFEKGIPATFEEATVTRGKLSQVATLLGYDPNEVMSVHADAHQVTVRTAQRLLGERGTELRFIEYVLPVI